jgi:hypothetical protein
MSEGPDRPPNATILGTLLFAPYLSDFPEIQQRRQGSSKSPQPPFVKGGEACLRQAKRGRQGGFCPVDRLSEQQ